MASTDQLAATVARGNGSNHAVLGPAPRPYPVVSSDLRRAWPIKVSLAFGRGTSLGGGASMGWGEPRRPYLRNKGRHRPAAPNGAATTRPRWGEGTSGEVRGSTARSSREPSRARRHRV